jgi:hypothetical protein
MEIIVIYIEKYFFLKFDMSVEMKSFVSLTDIAKSKLARGRITQEEYDEIIAADTRLQHAQHAQHGAVADPGVGARDARARTYRQDHVI